MNRIKNALKNYGFIGCLIKFNKKVFGRLYRKFESLDMKWMGKHNKEYSKLKKICTNKKYNSIFIFYPYTEWDIPIFQRPQQIALSLTKRDDILYLFCTKNNHFDHVEGIFKKVKDNLLVVTDFEYLNKLKLKNKIIHLYSTDTISKYSLIEKALKNNDKVLYEYIDEIHESISGNIPESFYQKHNKIMENEDVYIIATADKLLNDVKKCRKKNFALSTNGVTVEDFKYNLKIVPDEIKRIKKDYNKIICYYGSLAVWFDYELIKKCAAKYPDYAFILIGFEYDDSYKKSGVEEYKNIIYLGKIDYKLLINYTQHVDLLTIPFLINEVTESTSPVKLFEYMATQKPILTTAMPECKKYKSVIIGNNHDDYIKKIDSTIKLSKDEKYKKLETKEAIENTWDSKAETILNLVNGGKNE